MNPNENLPKCRQCPSGQFEMAYIRQSRFMPICHAKECVLSVSFPNNKLMESQHINRTNVDTVEVQPLENCPHIEKLRAKKVIPWATCIADFSKV